MFTYRSWPSIHLDSGKYALHLLLVGIGILGFLENEAQARCSGVIVLSGNDTEVQRILDAHGPGTVFCFEPGKCHFANPISPKERQVLISIEKGKAVLDGSVRVSGFVVSGQNWVVAVPDSLISTVPDPAARAVCQTYYESYDTSCNFSKSLYFDDRMFLRVLDLSQLDYGKYYEDPATNQIYLRDDPAGHIVEVAVAPFIIQVCQPGNPHCSNDVEIIGFVVQKAANPSGWGAVDAEGTAGWLFKNNEVRFNHGTGVVIDGSTIEDNYIHHNGQLGLSGSCAPSSDLTACFPNSSHNVRILNNEIAHNNTLNFSAQDEAGGGKWAATYGLLVRGNYVHDNRGPGLWCDITCFKAVFECNTLNHNILQKTAPFNGDGLGGGIIYEVSNKAIIRYNTFIDNDPDPKLGNDGLLLAAGIIVSASSGVDAYGNLVIGLNGIGVDMTSSSFDSNGTGLGRIDWCGTPPNNQYPDGSLFCTGLNSENRPIHEVLGNRFHNNVVLEKGGSVGGTGRDHRQLRAEILLVGLRTLLQQSLLLARSKSRDLLSVVRSAGKL